MAVLKESVIITFNLVKQKHMQELPLLTQIWIKKYLLFGFSKVIFYIIKVITYLSIKMKKNNFFINMLFLPEN